MAKEIEIVDQQTKILNKFMGSGKGNLMIYNDNRHNIIGNDISNVSWQRLLEIALDKAPKPRLRSIEAEIVRIADRKFDKREDSGKYLGVKRTTFFEKLKKADEETALTLVKI